MNAKLKEVMVGLGYVVLFGIGAVAGGFLLATVLAPYMVWILFVAVPTLMFILTISVLLACGLFFFSAVNALIVTAKVAFTRKKTDDQ